MKEFLADGHRADDAPAPENVTPKTIALKLAWFGALVAAAFCALYYVSERVNPVFDIASDRTRLIRERGDSFEAIAVGNSHNSSIAFEALGLDGLHLWRGGMEYYQTDYVLDVVEDELPNVHLVFVAADISSYGDNFLTAEVGQNEGDAHRETYVFGARMKGPGYLRSLRSDFPIKSDWKTLLQARFWPIARPDNWEGVLDRLRDPSIPAYMQTENGLKAEENRRVRIEEGEPEKRVPADTIRASAIEGSAIRLERRFALIKYRPEICEIGETLMNRIADAMGPDAITVFFTHTTNPLYVGRFDEADRKPNSFVECTPAYYAQVLDRERDDVIYIDLRHYEPVSDYPSLYYKNGDHFNREGARVFSARLRELLAERLREELPRGHPARELILSRDAPSLSLRNDTAVGQDALIGAGRRRGEVGD